MEIVKPLNQELGMPLNGDIFILNKRKWDYTCSLCERKIQHKEYLVRLKDKEYHSYCFLVELNKELGGMLYTQKLKEWAESKYASRWI
jgi:hypothetical protein